jgi:hypothetical protein
VTVGGLKEWGRRLGFIEEDRSSVICLLKKEKEIRTLRSEKTCLEENKERE